MYSIIHSGALIFVYKVYPCPDSPKSLMFIYSEKDLVFYQTGKADTSLEKMFTKLLSEGTASENFQAAMLIDDFNRMYHRFDDTVTPAYTCDELCMYRYRKDRSYGYTPVRVLRVRQIWRTASCNWDNQIPDDHDVSIEYECRDMDTGDILNCREQYLRKIEEVNDIKDSEKKLKAIKKLLSTHDIPGAFFLFDGKVYKL